MLVKSPGCVNALVLEMFTFRVALVWVSPGLLLLFLIMNPQ